MVKHEEAATSSLILSIALEVRVPGVWQQLQVQEFLRVSLFLLGQRRALAANMVRLQGPGPGFLLLAGLVLIRIWDLNHLLI